MYIERMGLFDMACPDINGAYRSQEVLTQHDRFWEDDYRLAVTHLHLTQLRMGVPWPLVQQAPLQYDWTLLDDRIAVLSDLGVEIVLALTQFSWPLWLQGAKHPVLSPMLPATFAAYTHEVCMRYGRHLSAIVPVIEIGTDAWSRASAGHWGPHVKDDAQLKHAIEDNLIKAFNAAAAVCHTHGIPVISHESANRPDIAVRLTADQVGIDHYTHANLGLLSTVLKQWNDLFRKTGIPAPAFSVLERGAPESYDVETGINSNARSDGIENRLKDIAYYKREIALARAKGIHVKAVGTFVIGNMWTDPSMQLDNPSRECDRNAIIDLYRSPDGTLERKFQPKLARAFSNAFS